MCAQVAGGESEKAGLVEWLPGLDRSPVPEEPGAAEPGALRSAAEAQDRLGTWLDAHCAPGSAAVRDRPGARLLPFTSATVQVSRRHDTMYGMLLQGTLLVALGVWRLVAAA